MELITSLCTELLQTSVEKVASYEFGQSLLKKADRGLWIMEKTAQWGVPRIGKENLNYIGADSSEMQENVLIRPLPWLPFLLIIMSMRMFRESVSFINLLRGHPPMRAANMVTYIQGRRRYLRALKYQGARAMRLRTTYSDLANGWLSIFKINKTWSNNNGQTNDSLHDDVIALSNQQAVILSESVQNTSNEIERLLEKMVDMDESSDDSDYTLTNADSTKSQSSEDEVSAQNGTLKDSSDTVSSSTPYKPIENVSSCESSFLNMSEIQTIKLDTEKFLNEEKSIKNVNRKNKKIANGKFHNKTTVEVVNQGIVKENEVPIVKITPVQDDVVSASADEKLSSVTSLEGRYTQGPKQEPAQSHSTQTSRSNTSNQQRYKKSKLKKPFWKNAKK